MPDAGATRALPSASANARRRIPREIWPYLRAVTITAMVGLALACWMVPAIGLPVLWGLVVPALPLIWVLAPTVWRNVCPMASANQVPRVLGFTRGRTLPRWLERYGYTIGAAVFFFAVALRPSVFESSGIASGLMLLTALVAATLGGAIYRGKSGFCGSVCPLRATQSVYARAPSGLVPHAHCRPCVGCTTNCQDLLPRQSLLADLGDRGTRGASRWVFAGLLPGFIYGFSLLADGASPMRAVWFLAAWSLFSLGLLTIADSYTSIGRGRLTAVWGAAALTLFYWTTTPDIAAAIEELGGVELGSAAVWEARIIVAIVAAIWLVRGWRLAAPAAEASGGTPPVPAPLGTLLPMVSPEAGAPGGEERRGELDPDAASERASAQAQLVASAFAAAAPIGQADDGSPDHASPLVASAAPVIAGSPPVQIPDRRGANRADRAPTVVFWPDGAAVPVPANEPTIAATARQVGIQLPEGCGTGLCGCDPVYIVGSAAGLAPAAEQERSTLHRLGLPAHARLACATRVIGDVVVSLEATPSEATPDLTVLRPAGLVVEPPTSPVAAPPPRDIKRVVIVGNGVAGVTAASHLRRLHPECTIDMVSRSPYPFYNRIAITRLIHQPQGLGSLQLMPDHWYETQRVTQWLNTSVASIDRARREVVLGTGQALPYDRLIMATGARWAKPPLPGIDTPGVFGLREAADAIRMRAYAQSRNVRRAAVLGGGLLGLEVAEALAKLGVDVTVVERGDSLAGHVLDPAAGRMLQRSVEAAGVRVRLGASVSEFVGERRLRALRLADGEDIAAELAIICVGIEPLVSVARDAGLEIQRGLVVDEQMRTSDPAILACGDVAEFEGQLGGHWAIGAAQAEVAAVTAFGGTRAFRPSPVPTVLKLDGINVLSVGCVRAGDGVVAVPDENNDDQSYQVTFVRGARPVGVIAINGGPGVDATVDAIVQGNELASAEALPAVRAS